MESHGQISTNTSMKIATTLTMEHASTSTSKILTLKNQHAPISSQNKKLKLILNKKVQN
jgi:hypothetical protein